MSKTKRQLTNEDLFLRAVFILRKIKTAASEEAAESPQGRKD